MKVSLIFASINDVQWAVLPRYRRRWIGAFRDRPMRRLYIFPLPFFGIVIQFGASP